MKPKDRKINGRCPYLFQAFNPPELPGVVRDERYAEAQGVRSDLRIQ